MSSKVYYVIRRKVGNEIQTIAPTLSVKTFWAGGALTQNTGAKPYTASQLSKTLKPSKGEYAVPVRRVSRK